MSSEGRTTRQQVAVRAALDSSAEFVSAQQLHAVLRATGERVGLATVYRALGKMSEGGEVDVLVRPDGETLYRSCSSGHHHHLICRGCGTTVEVAAPSVERWARDVAEREGFSDVSHTVELVGLCRACSQAVDMAP